jgi:hypothetical protein
MHADQGSHAKHRRTEAGSDRSLRSIHLGLASALLKTGTMTTPTAETSTLHRFVNYSALRGICGKLMGESFSTNYQ